MSKTGTRIYSADSVSGGLFPTFTACDCGCSLGHSEVTAGKSLQICKSREKQKLQAILGEAYELQASASKVPPFFHCRALLLHCPWPMRCCILLLLSTPAHHISYVIEYHIRHRAPKKDGWKREKGQKEDFKGECSPWKSKTSINNTAPLLGLTRIPKQHANIELLHSKLEPLKHKCHIFIFGKKSDLQTLMAVLIS